jgi:hypothetical protein
MLRSAILAALLFTACGEPEPVCQNNVIREAISPGGALKAVLFQRDCGGPTGRATQMSILAAGNTETGKGNAFIADTAAGGPTAAWGGPDVLLEWTGPQAITLTYDIRTRIIVGETSVRGVTISHKSTALTP